MASVHHARLRGMVLMDLKVAMACVGGIFRARSVVGNRTWSRSRPPRNAKNEALGHAALSPVVQCSAFRVHFSMLSCEKRESQYYKRICLTACAAY